MRNQGDIDGCYHAVRKEGGRVRSGRQTLGQGTRSSSAPSRKTWLAAVRLSATPAVAARLSLGYFSVVFSTVSLLYSLHTSCRTLWTKDGKAPLHSVMYAPVCLGGAVLQAGGCIASIAGLMDGSAKVGVVRGSAKGSANTRPAHSCIFWI